MSIITNIIHIIIIIIITVAAEPPAGRVRVGDGRESSRPRLCTACDF